MGTEAAAVVTPPAPAGAAAPVAPPPPAVAPAAGAPAAAPAATPSAAPVVPATYDLKPPDNLSLGSDWIDKTAAYAREQGLSQAQAQELMNRDAQVAARVADQQKASLVAASDAWASAAKSDQEIGGDAFPRNVELAKRALDRFGSPELRQALNETGLGNHPELLRAFYRVGKEMAEDRTILGDNSSSAQKKTYAEILYPSKT